MRVLAIDPGSRKCGIAVVDMGTVLHKAIIPRDTVVESVAALLEELHPERVVVGNGTGAQPVINTLQGVLQMPIIQVDEAFTSLTARKRYLSEHPARGLLRLVPGGLRVPKEPYDDYVAIILAERYISTMTSS